MPWIWQGCGPRITSVGLGGKSGVTPPHHVVANPCENPSYRADVWPAHNISGSEISFCKRAWYARPVSLPRVWHPLDVRVVSSSARRYRMDHTCFHRMRKK